MPQSMHLHTEIYPNPRRISESFKMYMKSFDFSYKHHEIIDSHVNSKTFPL